MAQGKIVAADKGDEVSDLTIASDATVIGTDDAWFIVGDIAGMTRDDVAVILERMRLRLLDPEITPFPLA